MIEQALECLEEAVERSESGQTDVMIGTNMKPVRLPAPILVVTQPQSCNGQLAVAAVRAGAVGLVDLGISQPTSVRRAALALLRRFAPRSNRCGIAWDVLGRPDRFPAVLKDLADQRWPLLLVAGLDFERHDLEEVLKQAREVASRVPVEVYSVDNALAAQEAGFDGLVVKGNEAGGRIGTQASFILLQALHGRLKTPYWIRGGISPHTAAASVLSGAAGVVLGEQLWLAKESPLDADQRRRLARLDGSQTVVLGDRQSAYRFFSGSGRPVLDEIAKKQEAGQPWVEPLHEALLELQSSSDPLQATLLPLGQEIAFASGLARRHVTTGGILGAFRRAMTENARQACRQRALDETSPLAQSHGMAYPVVQGPMTRVSDVPGFAEAVAQNGGLPTLALGVMREAEIRKLLEETGKRFEKRPWGVGVLGFVPPELWTEQLRALEDVRPDYAVLAGGRPSRAVELEKLGISTYLHVPSPGLLEAFLREGTRKFIFEGRECGGHVGPRSSFTLWSSIIEVVLAADVEDRSEIRILFAGGIHDRVSSAMVATMAAPLVAQGIQVGILVGTAYLFTPEAIESGAIGREFQQAAAECRETVLLESGPGHASRCTCNPFADEFFQRKQQLAAEGTGADQARFELEMFNLGRLRLAAKGLKRSTETAEQGQRKTLVEVSSEEQTRDGMFMIGEVATLRDRTIPMAELHADLCRGSVELLEQHVEESQEPAPTLTHNKSAEPLAIVGLGCLLPESEGPREYWQNILWKFDAIREVPDDRWDTDVFYNPDRSAPDQVYAKWGSFLRDRLFDPMKYRIPPKSLRSIEPIQLLALEVAWQALEDAGCFERDFPRERTSVIFGVAGPHELGMSYGFRTMLRQQLADARDELSPEVCEKVLRTMEARLPVWTEDSFPGILNNLVAGRISNQLDLKGPNFVVDAACAASMAAVYAAVQQLRSGACDVALVGGADATNSPLGFMSFSKTHALSPHGKSRPFDDSADGMVMGEGLAAMVLKRLADAERDGDRIYAVLRGIGSGSDGRNRSVTAPHAPSQILALRRAYDDAGVSPAGVSLVEAHGTGTSVGDRVEIEALDTLWKEENAPGRSCALGSVKSMIGHTKTTAGMAGLIKTVLALKHKVLPPTNNVEKPNQQVDFNNSSFYVNTEARPWIRRDPEQPRRAGVSAFGFGGSNFHAVLEEYTGDYYAGATVNLTPRSAEVFFWAEADRKQLVAKLWKLDEQLAQAPDVDLAQLGCSVFEESRRPDPAAPRNCRLSIVAADVADLRRKLQTAIAEVPNSDRFERRDGIYCEESEGTGEDQVCFVFPGHGAQHVGMLKDLLVSHPEGTAVFEQADRLLGEFFDEPLSNTIYPAPIFDEEQRKQHEERLEDTSVAQPALSVTGLFAIQVLQQYGLKPAFAAGYSHGEFVALHAAGSLSAEDLLKFSAIRGRAVQQTCEANPGGMAAVFADADTTEAALRDLQIPAQVSNLNAPKQTVIAGPAAVIDRAVKELAKRKLRTRRLPMAAAFHTPAMQPAAEKAEAYLKQATLDAPRIPVFSCATGRPFPDDADEMRQLMVRQLTEPVRFIDQIEAASEAGAKVFIELGAGNIATNYVARILQGKPHEAVALDVSDRAGDAQLAHLLARVARLGLPVTLDRWYAGRGLTVSTTAEYLAAHGEKTKPTPTQWLINVHRARPATTGVDRTNTKPRAAPATTTGKTAALSQEPPVAKPSSGSNGRSTPPISERTTRVNIPNRRTNESAGPAATSHLFRSGNGRSADADRNGDCPSEAGPPATTPRPAASTPAGPNGAFAALQVQMADWMRLQRQQLRVTERMLRLQEKALNSADGNLPAPVADPPERTVVPWETTRRPVAPSAAETAAPRSRRTQSPALRTISPTVVGPPPTNGHKPANAAPQQRRLVPIPPAETAKTNDELPPADEVPTKEEFRQNLLTAAADHTGYPIEMLDENALMEADLGIDSIKRIEIFSELKSTFAFLHYRERSDEEIFTSFTSLKTLGDILDAYDKERSGYLAHCGQGTAEETKNEEAATVDPKLGDAPTTAAGSGGVAPFPISRDEAAVERYVIRMKDSPLSTGHTTKSMLPEGQTVLMLGGLPGSEIAWARAEQPPCRVAPGPKASRVEPNHYQVDFASPDSVRELHELLAADGIRTGGIANLLGLGEPYCRPGVSGDDSAVELIARVLNIVKEFQAELKTSAESGGGRLINVTSMGGRFGFGAREPLPLAQAASVGFFKSLKHEWPTIRIKNIDLDLRTDPQLLLTNLGAEILSDDDSIEVGLSETGRQTVELVPNDLATDQMADADLDEDSVVLVTGGARGITAEITKALTAKYRCRLVLVGRSSEPDEEPSETKQLADETALRRYLIEKSGPLQRPAEINARIRRILRDRGLRENLDELRKTGASVDYRAVDVCDREAFEALIDGIYQRHGRIDGVIHAAGVIEDKRVGDKSLDSVARVMRTKIDAANVLARKLRGDQLKFFFLFSSVAGRFGNRGQTDYGAANEYLNKLAEQLDAEWPARVTAVNWGPWDRGFVDPALARHFERYQVQVIPTPLGVGHFIQEMETPSAAAAEVVVGCNIRQMEAMARGKPQ